ncbi:uncharacterized protein PV09_09659 [Verruconis gallopava]|uniref:Amino acid permease/ SLC12A domain-containing protein n=1 Tax=Verruconis gallopava TaxID=253628 RepID=A0A0D1YCZ8_9PEZI|nr:uncharacterized protein PV09_09659 [Verruconis gallopava]KIV98536.1 hypothetical protein PV09_09659 [Verruconis gallopava]
MNRTHAMTVYPVRDSLELASLASSSEPSPQSSLASSASDTHSSRKLSLDDDDPLYDTGHDGLTPLRRPRGRSYSTSSAFDFATNLFPLSSTATEYTSIGTPANSGLDSTHSVNGGSLEKHKSLTYLNGLALVIGLIIGSGIFSSPAQVNTNAGSPGASLLVWIVAGVLAWTGAGSYAELGGAIPLNGGAQVYLTKIFGECAGFLFTWSAVCVLKPGSAAIIAIIFGEYMVRAVVGADAMHVSMWINKAVAFAGIFLVTFFNCLSTKLGARLANIFMFLKFVALLAITVVGIVVAFTGFSWRDKANEEWKQHGWFDGTSTSISNWAVAIYAGLWAFDGWDNVNYVTGEFINPSKDLPLVIHTSVPLVMVSYILANIAYYLVLPTRVINSSNTVAVAFGQEVFGRVGALVLALAVSGSCFGALNATTFTSGRLVYAAGKEGYLPAFFGRIGIGSRNGLRVQIRPSSHPHIALLAQFIADDDVGVFYTPVNAMVLNALLTIGYVIVGEFSTLLTFYGVAGYTFYFATVLGLIVLRVKEPNLHRPYKTWITTPIVFCCVSLFLLSRTVFAQPGETLLVIAFVAAGVPVYLWRVRGRGGAAKRECSTKGASWWKFWRRLI